MQRASFQVLLRTGLDRVRSLGGGGGSDGNFTGALGVPTLDGLGAVGFDAHQLSERIDVASIVPRTRLMAGLLATLE